MVVGTVKITLHTPWVHSLKEKRMVVKSLCAKTRNKFNVSIAEVEEQDIHQLTVIGISCVTCEIKHGDSMINNVINFIESNTEGEIVKIERDLF